MLCRMLCAVLLMVSSLGAAEPTTHPATSLPSPGELMRAYRQRQARRAQMPRVAHFDLSEPILEKPADFSFFGEDAGTTLRELVDRLHQAGFDEQIHAVLITIGGGASLNLAQAMELRDALGAVTDTGKPVYIHGDTFDTATYILATGASRICMLEGGELILPGVRLETTFAKGLLDKIGVQADYVQIGEFKGADEQFTRTEPSRELSDQLNQLVEGLYIQIVNIIAKHRGIDPKVVRQAIDQAILTARDAKELKLIDELVDIDGLRPLLTEALGDEIQLIDRYGLPQRREVDLSNPFGLLALFADEKAPPKGPSIAVIHAEGVISEGDGADGLFESGVGSDRLRRAFRVAIRDENVKAIVIRIDSPGGSAIASEAMWQAARRAAKEKPLVVSVGSMAASGGYYLASAADTIYADPTAIIGSIGVVGGKFVVKDLFDKVGLSTTPFSRGANADLFSSTTPFTERQKALVTRWMSQTYDQFQKRILAIRADRIADFDQVARGRIFLAPDALKLGLIDRIGGLRDAIDFVAGEADLHEGGYDIRILPRPRTLGDILRGEEGQSVTAPLPRGTLLRADSLLHAVEPSLRAPLLRHLQLLHLLQQHPVILAMPYSISIR